MKYICIIIQGSLRLNSSQVVSPRALDGLCDSVCATLCDPMDCSSPDYSVHGIFQAGILEWLAIFFSGDSRNPGTTAL